MGQQRGAYVPVYVELESTFKTTPAATNADKLTFVSESLRLNRNLITSKSLTGSRQAAQPVRGNMDVAGDISLELAPNQGKLLKAVFGALTTQALGTNRYRHKFSVGDLPSFSLEKRFGDLASVYYAMYNGIKVNSFKLNTKTEGFIDCSLSCVGAKETLSAAAVFYGVTSRTASLYTAHNPFDAFSGNVVINGSISAAYVSSVDFSIENGIDTGSYVIDGTGLRYSLPDGIVKVSGTITALFESVSLYQDAINFTEKRLELSFYRGSGVPGYTGSYLDNERIEFYFDEILLKPQGPVAQGPTGMVLELPFEAYYANDSTGNSTAATAFCWLYNAIPSF